MSWVIFHDSISALNGDVFKIDALIPEYRRYMLEKGRSLNTIYEGVNQKVGGGGGGVL